LFPFGILLPGWCFSPCCVTFLPFLSRLGPSHHSHGSLRHLSGTGWNFPFNLGLCLGFRVPAFARFDLFQPLFFHPWPQKRVRFPVKLRLTTKPLFLVNSSTPPNDLPLPPQPSVAVFLTLTLCFFLPNYCASKLPLSP